MGLRSAPMCLRVAAVGLRFAPVNAQGARRWQPSWHTLPKRFITTPETFPAKVSGVFKNAYLYIDIYIYIYEYMYIYI
jgi:hypothetical protein